MLEESDPNMLRDVEIKRLVRMANIAFENTIDAKLTLRMRESWHQRYTNTVLALNQLLKDSQYKDYRETLEYHRGIRKSSSKNSATVASDETDSWVQRWEELEHATGSEVKW